MTEKQKLLCKRLIAAGSLLVFLGLSAALFILVGRPLLRHAAEPEQFRAWLDGYGAFSRLIFIGIVLLQVVVAVIPGEPFEIAAGYAFGTLEGTLLCLAGILLGSAIIFWLSRKCGTLLLETFFSKEKIDSMKFLKETQKLELLFFAVMFIPGTPKDLLTYFAPLTRIRFSSYMLIIAVARIPSIITSTIGGNALGQQRYLFAAIAFGVTLIISVLGLLIYRKIQKRR